MVCLLLLAVVHDLVVSFDLFKGHHRVVVVVQAKSGC